MMRYRGQEESGGWTACVRARTLRVLLTFGVVLATLPATAEQSDRPQIVRLRVGFRDHYKVGLWTPVDVTVLGGTRAAQGVVTLEVPDSDGTTTRVGRLASQANACQVLPGAETTVRMYARFGQTDCGVTAALCEAVSDGDHVRAGKTLASKTFAASIETRDDSIPSGMAATQQLLVTLGPGSVGAEEAVGLAMTTEGQGALSDREPTAVLLGKDDVDRLPTRWYGYEGVDALLLATSVPEIYRKLAPDSSRLEALDEWVRMGGKLLLFVGSQADEVLAPGSGLARFAPGPTDGTFTLKTTGALEAFAGSTKPVPGMGAPQSGVPIPRLRDVEGTVEVREEGVPLVVRRPYGLGQVIFVAADFDRPPFARWPDRALFLKKLIDVSAPGEESSEGGQLSHYGYNDISGQLRSALDRFSGVKMVSFWLVAGLILLYILLIGPGDYFFLRKVLGRMQWTWVTFPAIVLLVSLGAYLLAYWLKGDQLRTNQVDVVDVDAASGRARGTTWLNLFSPRTDTYDLSFEPRLPDGRPADDAHTVVSWLGLAGDGLGGMQPRARGTPVWGRAYDFSPDLDSVRGVPVQVWSTKSVTARWTAPCNAWPKAKLVQENQLPEGTVTNTLDFPLARCVLAYGRWGYDLGTLKPGQTAPIEPMSKSRIELTTLLTGPKTLAGAGRGGPGAPTYTRDSDDLFQIVRTMMFFEALGGSRRADFMNRYQGFIDSSALLKAGRAVLLAEGPARDSAGQSHGAVLLRDGEPLARPGDAHLVLYRFVYPVGKKHD